LEQYLEQYLELLEKGGGFFLKTKVFHFWKSRNEFNEMMSIELCLGWIFMIEDKMIISKGL